MKKILVLLLALLLVFSIVSCTNNPPNNTQDGEENTDNTENNTPSSDKAKFVVDYMRAMATVQWTPQKTFQLYGKYQAWGYNLTYEQGKTYYGTPFLTDSRGSMQEFVDATEDGVYIGGTSNDTCIGSACYDAVYLSLIQVCPSISFTSTSDMLPKNETGLSAVGDWDINITKQDTPTLCRVIKIEKMAEYYGMLNPGDVVLKHVVEQDAGHVRIVAEKPVVEYSNGKINPFDSYIVTLEQTNSWDKDSDVNTTWWVNKKYTFNELFTSFFVPLTPVDYTKNEEVTITAKNLLGPDDTAKSRKLKGEINSNNYITQINIEIKNSNKKTIYEKNFFPNTKDVYLEDLKYVPRLVDFESGTYSFKMKAYAGRQNKVLADYDFILE